MIRRNFFPIFIFFFTTSYLFAGDLFASFCCFPCNYSRTTKVKSITIASASSQEPTPVAIAPQEIGIPCVLADIEDLVQNQLQRRGFLHVVIVDDAPLLANILKRTILHNLPKHIGEGQGIDFQYFVSYAEFNSNFQFERLNSESETFLFVFDVQTGEENTNGIEELRKLRKKYFEHELPLIIYTSESDLEQEQLGVRGCPFGEKKP